MDAPTVEPPSLRKLPWYSKVAIGIAFIVTVFFALYMISLMVATPEAVTAARERGQAHCESMELVQHQLEANPDATVRWGPMAYALLTMPACLIYQDGALIATVPISR